jgi:hypothetical protein
MEKLQNLYNDWRNRGEEGTNIPFTWDCGEKSAREDFTEFAELKSNISFEKMLELEENFNSNSSKIFITVEYRLGYGYIGMWEGDHIPISEIPESDYHKFWGTYEYTHGGELWKKACEKISDLKKEGRTFQDGEKIIID